MSSALAVDVFVEDRGHEKLIVPLVRRLAFAEGVRVTLAVRAARGGHGRVLNELALYQRAVNRGIAGMRLPDILVVGKDANCSTFAKARADIHSAVEPEFVARIVVACPDPHVERWYLADPESFKEVVGQRPTVARRKCEHDYYKAALAKTVRDAGHPSTLGGIEFAQELVDAMDLYRASKNERSLKAFLDDLRAVLRARGSG